MRYTKFGKNRFVVLHTPENEVVYKGIGIKNILSYLIDYYCTGDTYKFPLSNSKNFDGSVKIHLENDGHYSIGEKGYFTHFGDDKHPPVMTVVDMQQINKLPNDLYKYSMECIRESKLGNILDE